MEKRQGDSDWIKYHGNYVCSGLGANLGELIMDILKSAVTAWNLLITIICVMIAMEYIQNCEIRSLFVIVQMAVMQVLTIITIWRRQV